MSYWKFIDHLLVQYRIESTNRWDWIGFCHFYPTFAIYFAAIITLLVTCCTDFCCHFCCRLLLIHEKKFAVDTVSNTIQSYCLFMYVFERVAGVARCLIVFQTDSSTFDFEIVECSICIRKWMWWISCICSCVCWCLCRKVHIVCKLMTIDDNGKL